MNWIQSLFAGIIQGLTEFLPVSSSGHLVMYNELMGNYDPEKNLAFSVFLHLGSLVAVLLIFRKDVWMVFKEFFTAIFDICRGKPNFKTPERRLMLMLVIATIPAFIMGGLIQMLGFTAVLDNIYVTGAMLIVTALLMFAIHKISKRRTGGYEQANAPLGCAAFVGLMQAIAIAPGLSRSGSTIFAGMTSGLNKEFAVRFSFLMSIPVILGAAVFDFLGLGEVSIFDFGASTLIIGFVAAFITGIIAIKLIRFLIKSNKFYIFGIYCLLAAAAAFSIGIFNIRI